MSSTRAATLLLAIHALACSATRDDPAQAAGAGAGSGSDAATSASSATTGAGGELIGTGGSGGGTPIQVDPATCEEAALAKSYVGCDYWPTVVDNIVRDIFDFAVVVANNGSEPAEVTVTRLGETVATATVEPNALQTLYLPWVPELKSPSTLPFCAPSSAKTETVHAVDGAYHLVSTRPVAVNQFNAIQYAGKGGPPGKDWSACAPIGCIGGCFSYTNDASLLLPTTALTGTYRIAGAPAWPDESFTYPPYFAVTGTADGTQVTVKLSPTGAIAGGGGVASTPPGGTTSFSLDKGDVVMVVGTSSADFSGSLVTATAPVQVITGISCTQMPDGTEACDHIEESLFPAETLGKHYFVTMPTGPHGVTVGHVVRIYGNVDGTLLTYPGANPGAPAVIGAGEVVDLGAVTTDFEIVGDHEFTVASFQIGAGQVDPNAPIDQQKGDPAQSFMTAVEQYRTKYVFLAPADYDTSFVDIVAPNSAVVSVDGVEVGGFTSQSSGFGLARYQLGPGNAGAHVLTASAPVGIQVVGYGTYTSYQYPGGSNLGHISPPPPK
jgi:hypothetical protein